MKSKERKIEITLAPMSDKTFAGVSAGIAAGVAAGVAAARGQLTESAPKGRPGRPKDEKSAGRKSKRKPGRGRARA